MNNMLAVYALCAGLLVSLGLWAFAMLAIVRWQRRVNQQEVICQSLKDDIRALCAGAVGLDQRVSSIEQRSRRLKERQEQLELRDNGERSYAQAIRMVHRGADVEELVSVCGLSRGEAELISMMHRMDEAS
jgi:hypothetical protein